MPLNAVDLREQYARGWLEGIAAFRLATASDDDGLLAEIDLRLSMAPDTFGSDTAHPLDRVEALGLHDGYKAARTQYAAALKAAPWQPLVHIWPKSPATAGA